MADREYYERRLREERLSAARARQGEAVAAHHRLAELYSARLEQLDQTADGAMRPTS